MKEATSQSSTLSGNRRKTLLNLFAGRGCSSCHSCAFLPHQDGGQFGKTRLHLGELSSTFLGVAHHSRPRLQRRRTHVSYRLKMLPSVRTPRAPTKTGVRRAPSSAPQGGECGTRAPERPLRRVCRAWEQRSVSTLFSRGQMRKLAFACAPNRQECRADPRASLIPVLLYRGTSHLTVSVILRYWGARGRPCLRSFPVQSEDSGWK